MNYMLNYVVHCRLRWKLFYWFIDTIVVTPFGDHIDGLIHLFHLFVHKINFCGFRSIWTRQRVLLYALIWSPRKMRMAKTKMCESNKRRYVTFMSFKLRLLYWNEILKFVVFMSEIHSWLILGLVASFVSFDLRIFSGCLVDIQKYFVFKHSDKTNRLLFHLIAIDSVCALHSNKSIEFYSKRSESLTPLC